MGPPKTNKKLQLKTLVLHYVIYYANVPKKVPEPPGALLAAFEKLPKPEYNERARQKSLSAAPEGSGPTFFIDKNSFQEAPTMAHPRK